MPNKHLETLLTTAGIPAEDVAAIFAVPEDQQDTFDVNPYVERVRNTQRAQLQNDPAFFNDLTLEKLPADIKKKMENASFGRAQNIVKDKLLKVLNMNESDYADLPPEVKDKFETLIPAITEKWTKSKSGDKELQQQLIEARKKLEQFGPDYEETIKSKYEAESNQKINNMVLRSNVVGELSAIEGLKIPAADLAKTAEDIFLSKYAYERTGDFTIELRRKDNQQMKVLKDNSSQELTLREAIAEIAKDRNWISEEKKDDKGGGRVTVTPDKNGTLKMIAPHLQDKISKKIAAEK